MIGVGGNDTREIEEIVEECKDACDYIMLTVPYYNKPSQEGLIAHFTHIANKFETVKFVLYNIPGRSSVNLEVDSLVEILNNCLAIAQMLIEKHESVIFSKVTQLSETERASGGFGSTGIN